MLHANIPGVNVRPRVPQEYSTTLLTCGEMQVTPRLDVRIGLVSPADGGVSGKMTFLLTFPYFSSTPAWLPTGSVRPGSAGLGILMDLEYSGVTPADGGISSRAM